MRLLAPHSFVKLSRKAAALKIGVGNWRPSKDQVPRLMKAASSASGAAATAVDVS